VLRDQSDFFRWWQERRAAHHCDVRVVDLDQLEGWRIDPDSGNIRHHTGRFFSVEGVRVATDHRVVESWSQPIIIQPEIGILGILVKRFDGVPHYLMQAKMEPGNVNLLQLSPTVQATRSNYTGIHRGRTVPYLDYFVSPRPGRVLFDALQSEQGAWFLAKRNRNLVVEVDEDVPLLPEFHWLSMDEIQRLLRVDNLVNMDARTVLSGVPRPAGEGDPDNGARHTTAELLSWFTEAKARYSLRQQVVRLSAVENWVRSGGRIHHEQGHYFDVIGVDVVADSREVDGWQQPMLAPTSQGVIGFLAKRIDGVLHVLVQARTEAGTLDVVEMAATVNCCPANHEHLPPEQRPRFLDEILSAPPERLLLDVVLSEEGGRFYAAQNRYRVVEVDDGFPVDVPEDFVWMTIPQLAGLVRFGNHVAVCVRSLLSCIA
jgi:oxidase EvaA